MQEITVKELKQKMKDKDDFQLIDCRETYENEAANLGGESYPMAELIQNASNVVSKDKPVIIHCRSGKRSAAVVMQLEKQLGLENLYNLKGGILAWKEEIDPDLDVS